MKLTEIEPILNQVAAYFKHVPECYFESIDYAQDDIVDALESLLQRVGKTITNRKNVAIDPKKKVGLENAGERWSDEDNKTLVDLFINRFDPLNPQKFYGIAGKKLKRSRGAIRSRLGHWRYTPNPYDPEHVIQMLKELRENT